jgi:hypothetical protein
VDWDAAGNILTLYAECLRDGALVRRAERRNAAERLVAWVSSWETLPSAARPTLLAHLFRARGWLADAELCSLLSDAARAVGAGDAHEVQAARQSADALRRFFAIFHHAFCTGVSVILIGRIRRWIPVAWQGPSRITHVEPIYTNASGGFHTGYPSDEVFVLLDGTDIEWRIVGRHEYQHYVDTVVFGASGVATERWELEYLAYLGTALTLSRWLREGSGEKRDPRRLFAHIFGPDGSLRAYLKAKEQGEVDEEHVVGTDRAVREFVAEVMGRDRYYRDRALNELFDSERAQGKTESEAEDVLVGHLRDLPWRMLVGYLNVLKGSFGADPARFETLARSLMERHYRDRLPAMPEPLRHFLDDIDVTALAPVEVVAPDGRW